MLRSIVVLVGLGIAAVSAQDIAFTNKVVSFTNLQGEAFSRVELVRGGRLGLIWRDDSGGGRVLYTNLSPAFLASIGISSNWVEAAKQAIAHKAEADARFRSTLQAQGAEQARARAAQDAAWQAGEPAREKAAAKQADLQRIQALQRQVDAAQYQYDHKAAAVHDYNMSTLNDPTAPILYMSEQTRQQIEDAKAQLEKLKEEYRAKWREEPLSN